MDTLRFVPYQPESISKEHFEKIVQLEQWLIDGGFAPKWPPKWRHPDLPGVEWIVDWSDTSRVVVYQINREVIVHGVARNA